MEGQVVMDFDGYRSKLSKNLVELLEIVEGGTLNQLQNCSHQFESANEEVELFNYILLVTALQREHKSITEFLITKNCPLKTSKKTGHFCTPLYYAVKIGDLEIFKRLWKKGACLFDKDFNDASALELAMVQLNNNIVNFILNNIELEKRSEDLPKDREMDVDFFLAACWIGDFKAIKMFISRKSSLLDSRSAFNRDDWRGFTPLHFTVSGPSTQTKAIAELLKHKKIDFLAQDERGKTPLHLVFRNNRDYVFKKKIVIEKMKCSSAKKFINPADEHGLSHFHIFCSHHFGYVEHEELVKYFIDNGVDVNSSISPEDADLPGCTALHIAIKRSHLGILELLLKNRADPKIADINGTTPLHLVCSHGKIERQQRLIMLKLLLEHGADPMALDSKNRTPLHCLFYAYKKSFFLDDCGKLLLSQNPSGFSHTDKGGLSYLHIACSGGDLEVVKTLIKNGALVNSCIKSSSFGRILMYTDCSALHISVIFNRADLVELLLVHGADVNAVDEYKQTPLHLACDNFMDEKLHPLYNESRSVSQIDWMPSRINQIRIIELLIKHGASVDAKDSLGLTPLMKNFKIHDDSTVYFEHFERNSEFFGEISSRQKKVMGILLSNGADINTCNDDSGSILHILLKDTNSSTSNEELLKFILDEGADVNSVSKREKLTSLHVAVEVSLTEFLGTSFIKLLLQRGANINARSKKLETPLHLAVKQHSTQDDIVITLLSHPEIDINARNNRGKTPLHLAIQNLNYFCTEILLQSGADINAEDSTGGLPMHWIPRPTSHGNIQNIMLAIVRHVKTLMKSKLFVSKKTSINVTALSMHLIGKKDELASIDSKIDKQLEYLKSKQLDKYTTLYDLLSKDSNAMAKHVMNDNLRAAIPALIDQYDHHSNVPLWDNYTLFVGFLRQQFSKGSERLLVLKPAKLALNLVSNMNWPDSCSEEILSFLSNENLADLIRSARSDRIKERPVPDSSLLEEPPTKTPRLDK